MDNGDVKFITKEIQTEALENHLNRLEKNIHKFSAVPDLSDENFAGNLSGVAIRFKLFGLETKCIIKERKMEKAIKELVRVLSVPIHVNTGREVDTKMDKLCDGLSDEVVLKVTHGEHRVKRSWNKNFDYVVDVGIPKINPNYIGTYDTNLHEEMHFLDMLITVKDNKDKLPSNMFSQSYKPLVEAFDKATPVIGDKAKKLFEDFAKECDIIYKEKQEAFDIQHEKLKEQYRSGVIDWKKYNSLFKKLQKEVNEEADNKRRALFGGGVSGLQDIYDAVSKGTFRDTGQVTYGHGSAYYTDRRRTNPNCSESLANYASLCVGHPELIDILAEDYPEIVTALRGCVEAMLKEVPK